MSWHIYILVEKLYVFVFKIKLVNSYLLPFPLLQPSLWYVPLLLMWVVLALWGWYPSYQLDPYRADIPPISWIPVNSAHIVRPLISGWYWPLDVSVRYFLGAISNIWPQVQLVTISYICPKLAGDQILHMSLIVRWPGLTFFPGRCLDHTNKFGTLFANQKCWHFW